MSKHRVLSIDAWGSEDGWEWNDWNHVSTYDTKEHGEINEENFLKFMVKKESERKAYSVTDDQYNLVLERAESGKPLYALEYGSEINEDAN